MMDTFSQEKGFAIPGVVTGKPVEIGGSLGRTESTGRGVVYTVQHAANYLKKAGKQGPRSRRIHDRCRSWIRKSGRCRCRRNP